MTANRKSKPDCLRCKHFFVTWDPQRPRGCHVHGFKSVEYPQTVVVQASGLPCQFYDEKRQLAETEPQNELS